LRGIDFKVAPGETIGLLGRNGMGKTTLLRSLLGHVKPQRGEVRVRGVDMTGEHPERIARQGVAYVPEGRGIFPNLTVRENLVMAARAGVNGGRAWTLARVLESFPRIGERLSHRGDQLSGGEQQMLSIGRALLTNPDVLLLDEATEGLAPLVAREIWKVIAAIRQAGVATVVVDRNYGAVLAHADHCILMVKGEVVADLPSGELRSRPELLRRHLGI
jgi:branched-chain amino acid transport system ATP-binding protein